MNTDNFKIETNTDDISPVCKSCGGNLTKSESVYICDNCGETYSQTEFLEMGFTPQNNGNLIMIIEDAFTITGRGTVITGETKSEISTGETVTINNVQYIVTGIESFRKIIPSAQAGTPVGLLLQNAVATSFKRGDEVLRVNSTIKSNSPEVIARELVSAGMPPLNAIKELRERTGLGLAEAKNYIDNAMAGNTMTNQPVQQSGGCYIATCVYGSYNCPEVWTLRRFRDNYLSTNLLGKCFVKMYYAISPSLVKHFGETMWFKSFWKELLDKFTCYLKNKGYSDSEYRDK